MRFSWLLLAGILMFSQAQETEEPTFKLYILKEGWQDLRLGYDYAPSWAILQKIDIEEPLAIITEADIESYNWADQVITLTPEASERLMEELELTPNEWLLNHDLYQQAFIVELAGERLYGGIFLPGISAMGIQFPVIYPQLVEDTVQFYIRPIHSVTSDYPAIPAALRRRIELQAVQDFFRESDQLMMESADE